MVVSIALLWGILLFAELAAMVVLLSLNLPSSQAIWLEPLLDASMMAVVAVYAVPFALKQGPLSDLSNRQWIQLKAALLVFGVQLLLTLLMPLLKLPYAPWQLVVLDAGCFSVLSTVGIYLSIIRPEQELAECQPGSYRHRSHRAAWLGYFSSYLFIMALVGLLLLTLFRSQQADQLAKLYERQQSALSLTHSVLTHELHDSLQDLLILSRKADLLRFVEQPEAAARAELEYDFKTLVETRRAYHGLSYTDRLGQHIEVTDSGAQSNQGLIPGQPMATHLLLEDILLLGPGEVSLVSMLQGEGHSPVRLAAPVFDQQGLHHGLMVLELSSDYLIKLLTESFGSQQSQLALINPQGVRWILPSDANQPMTLAQQQQLQRWALLPRQAVIDSRQKDTQLVTTHRLQQVPELVTDIERFAMHGGWPQWSLVSVLDGDQLNRLMASQGLVLLIVFVMVALLSGIGTLVYCRVRMNQLEVEQQIYDMAHHDSLTGLDNRQLFREKLALELAHAKRNASWLGLIYLDLDRFKPINDSYGHEVGDQALIEVVQRLRPLLRASDSFARIGGDEFAIILPNASSLDELELIASRLLEMMEADFEIVGHCCQLGASIGISLCQGELTVDQFIRQADMAMYEAKQSLDSGYKVHQPVAA